MTSLQRALDSLHEFLVARGLPPPHWEPRLLEIEPDARADERGRLHVRRSQLRSASDYAARFDELLASGFDWINVSCYGALDGTMLVAIERPRETFRGSSRTSVNFSGPMASVRENDWSVDSVLAVE